MQKGEQTTIQPQLVHTGWQTEAERAALHLRPAPLSQETFWNILRINDIHYPSSLHTLTFPCIYLLCWDLDYA